ncbi:IclR family transcriptional regulator [Mycobacterium sp. 1465703.0]|uniref:IclR family transcriptional regulator n=1 Tax=Mycobacterium sp. 1465703.0 TaxID=1834078 RepID=UPI0018D45CAD
MLEAVSELQPVGLTELTRQLGLPKTTVHRGLTSLAEDGWLEGDPDDSTRWIVGMKAFIVGSTVSNRGSLRERALPFMHDLSSDVGETIHLMIRDGDQVVLIERVDSPHPVRAIAPLGARAPLHASSNGKAILARLPSDEITHYVQSGLSAVTARTVTRASDMYDELQLTRKRGYAVADEELQEGVVSIAAPILDSNSRPIGSVSISGPKPRMPKSVRPDYGRKVRSTAEQIGGSLPAVFTR